MSTSPPDIPVDAIDTRQLSGLIVELNIARRNSRSYPPGHPLVESSLEELVARYAEIMETEQEIRISVARDTLMYGNTALDRNNPVFRDFARTLFQCGIGALAFAHGLTATETRSFLAILDMKR
jgi:hypothetical protein